MAFKRRKRRIAVIAALCCAVVAGAVLWNFPAKRKPLPTPRVFYRDVMLPTTPMKNQGSSSLCWAYAMLATIETEHLVQGDSVNLSVDYVARAYLREQAENRFMKGFPFNGDSDDHLSTRGMAPMLIDLIQTYGLAHYDAYHRGDQADMGVITRKLQKCVDGTMTLPDLRQGVDQILDDGLGPMPQSIFMFGTRYTPLEFAHSVCKEKEWVAMTSFTHHPFYQRFALEVPTTATIAPFSTCPSTP